MKKHLLQIICIFFISSSAFSQPAHAIRIDKLDAQYIILSAPVLKKSLWTKTLTLYIDYGQGMNSHKEYENNILDENGKLVIFKSIAHALNYFYSHGYELNYFSNELSGDSQSYAVFILEKVNAVKRKSDKKMEDEIAKLNEKIQELSKTINKLEIGKMDANPPVQLKLLDNN